MNAGAGRPDAAAALEGIRNFRRVDARLVSSGQPSEAQLAAAAAAGVEVVINLGLHDDLRYALADEAGTVRALGMRYVHLPVRFGDPDEASLRRFFDAMEEHRARRVLLHCAANIRATAFLGLYRVIRLGWPRRAAFEPMDSVWTADAVWSRFIDEMLAAHAPAAKAPDSTGAST